MYTTFDTPLNLQESITMPVYLLPAVIILVNFFFEISHGMVLENPLYTISMHTEFQDIMNSMRFLSEGILNLNQDLHFSTPSESIERYRNLVDLHASLQQMFHCLQVLIIDLEQLASTVHNDQRLNFLCDLYIEHGDRLREEHNLFITALRSLEDNIRNNNPAFVFLTHQWFE